MAKSNKVDVAQVFLWNQEVGAIAWDENRQCGVFEYTSSFARSGLEVSPLQMPVIPGRLYQFPQLNNNTFQGLPGLLADSLPDRFGNLLINKWLTQQGRSISDFSPIERLCYMGSRSMGALEFKPALSRKRKSSFPVEVAGLVELVNEIMQARENLTTNLMSNRDEALEAILRVGTSAGGARPKAVIAYNPTTEEVRSGQLDIPPGFEAWLLKFDGVKDKHFSTPQGYGRVEYAYFRMARQAGIEMEDCRLLSDHEGRSHFMTRRFDRLPGNEKKHMHSLCGIAHYDFNFPGAYSYEQALEVIRRLSMGQDKANQLYRRMVFNVLARNQDDHTRNISFIMDKSGEWTLAPAYDMVWSYNPKGDWTSTHQMSINGKRDHFEINDLLAVAKSADIKQAKELLHDVAKAIIHWPDFAREASVPKELAKKIQASQRLDLIDKLV